MACPALWTACWMHGRHGLPAVVPVVRACKRVHAALFSLSGMVVSHVRACTRNRCATHPAAASTPVFSLTGPRGPRVGTRPATVTVAIGPGAGSRSNPLTKARPLVAPWWTTIERGAPAAACPPLAPPPVPSPSGPTRALAAPRVARLVCSCKPGPASLLAPRTAPPTPCSSTYPATGTPARWTALLVTGGTGPRAPRLAAAAPVSAPAPSLPRPPMAARRALP